MSTCARSTQSRKAELPILFKPVQSVRFFSSRQLQNASLSILTTRPEILTSVNRLHPLKVAVLISISLTGDVGSVWLLQPISTLVKPLQPLNAYIPIHVTLSGITRFVNPLQPLNAYDPISFTLSGIMTSLSLTQFRNALLPMLTTPFGIAPVFNSPQ